MKKLLILLLILSCMLIISCDMIDTSMFKGEAKYFTVEFDSTGGSDVAPVQAEQNCIVKRPHNPTKEGCFFEGWYDDDGDKWSFVDDTVDSDMTLYAKLAQRLVVNMLARADMLLSQPYQQRAMLLRAGI